MLVGYPCWAIQFVGREVWAEVDGRFIKFCQRHAFSEGTVVPMKTVNIVELNSKMLAEYLREISVEGFLLDGILLTRPS